jgi:hypothetical protein
MIFLYYIWRFLKYFQKINYVKEKRVFYFKFLKKLFFLIVICIYFVFFLMVYREF